ncbi:Rolling circle replication protein Rep [Halomicrobium sp. LC1Hm]|nr:Rolling circle replication protein Rep [Halomicrobium sp. LC1Hm]
MLDATESFEAGDDDRESSADWATWKLALYWATNRRFWSCSDTDYCSRFPGRPHHGVRSIR